MTDFQHIADAALARATGPLDAFTFAYVTKCGTWVVASTPLSNDDNKPHDLFAVTWDEVVALRPTVHPEIVAQVRAAIQAAMS